MLFEYANFNENISCFNNNNSCIEYNINSLDNHSNELWKNFKNYLDDRFINFDKNYRTMYVI